VFASRRVPAQRRLTDTAAAGPAAAIRPLLNLSCPVHIGQDIFIFIKAVHMPLTHDQILRFLKSVHPYDSLPQETQEALAGKYYVWEVAEGTDVYEFGKQLPGLFLVYEGASRSGTETARLSAIWVCETPLENADCCGTE
jgi:hypothetical protein